MLVVLLVLLLLLLFLLLLLTLLRITIHVCIYIYIIPHSTPFVLHCYLCCSAECHAICSGQPPWPCVVFFSQLGWLAPKIGFNMISPSNMWILRMWISPCKNKNKKTWNVNALHHESWTFFCARGFNMLQPSFTKLWMHPLNMEIPPVFHWGFHPKPPVGIFWQMDFMDGSDPVMWGEKFTNMVKCPCYSWIMVLMV